ncbi:hypothetical protein [Archangium sp.]|jgi:hypothetical protein|uniref:hypothetical protein n=1 Tax=Archangium sp. TaxID=1872627 RepID=UPI002EDB2FD7
MVTRQRGGQRRGQGTVEMALGLLLFVTVFIFGIHFAEVGYLSLKVQEAATSALWDTTSARMHSLPGNFSGLHNAIGAAGGHATERYKDFDGRTSRQGRQQMVQVFTSADKLEVTCAEEGAISFKASNSTNSIYANVGGMRCSSSAEMSPIRIPRNFVDQGSGAIFDVAHAALKPIPVCGMGRAKKGKCEGAYGILLDDWGLAGHAESQECVLLDTPGCANTAYYDSAKIVYDAHNGVDGSSVNLAQEVVGKAPINPARFWMSFQGMGDFKDKEPGGDNDPNDWVTTPGANSPTEEYDSSYNGRGDCFLGASCN